MSDLLLGLVLLVRTYWFRNMITLPSWLVSYNFGTWSCQCLLYNIATISLYMSKCCWAHTHTHSLSMYCSHAITVHAVMMNSIVWSNCLLSLHLLSLFVCNIFVARYLVCNVWSCADVIWLSVLLLLLLLKIKVKFTLEEFTKAQKGSASIKAKCKGRLCVLQHCCLEAYCTLTRMSSFIHPQRRCTHQATWETSVSAGRKYTWNLASNP